jgi:putative two-component system response regulator
MPSERASSAIKVLIVDDDAIFSRSMRRILVGAGYDCSEANSGAAARARLNDGGITAVLCDVSMPGESGLDLLASVAADFPEVAVVMTTGADDPPTAALAFEIGAYGYLIKPFTANEICITLSGALRRRELEAARRSHLRGLERTMTRLRGVRGVVSHIAAGVPWSSTDSATASTDSATASVDSATATVERLSRSLSLDHEEPRAHIERMSRYSAALAEAVGFSGCSAEEFRLAAALHDVGKVAVPEPVLLKPGALSPEEIRAMQRHSRIGYQLLAGSTSPLLKVAASIAFGHHEWWDGNGYPRGLRGEDIPLEARIVAVTDSFDAVTSHRVYRPALSFEAATAAMTERRGRQFEPRLLDVFGALRAETETIRAAYPDPTDEPPIRVLVVDHDEVFVQDLLRLLGAEPNITVVGSAGTGAEAEEVAVVCEPDVVLMGSVLPDADASRVTEALRALVPDAQVIMFADEAASMRVRGASCAGFVSKAAPKPTLLAAIRAVHDGEAPSSALMLPRLVAQPYRGRPNQARPTLGSDLRPRELEVLRLMAAGVPNKAVATQLYISLNTVRNHVQSILYKLDAHSKLEAVATAVREGVIQFDRGGPSS